MITIKTTENRIILKTAGCKFEDDIEVIKEEETANDVPTDLTGYTVSVPSGWTVSAGYKTFYSLNYDLYEYDNDFTYAGNEMLGLGYRAFDIDSNDFEQPTDNYIETGQPTLLYYDNTAHLRFTFTGGNDVTNTDLIQWFVDMGATFIYHESGGSN